MRHGKNISQSLKAKSLRFATSQNRPGFENNMENKQFYCMPSGDPLISVCFVIHTKKGIGKNRLVKIGNW